MKFILKKKAKVENFRWILYVSYDEGQSISHYGLFLRFKNRLEIPVYTNHRYYIISTKEVQELASMYLKSQGFIRDKYTWLDRSK